MSLFLQLLGNGLVQGAVAVLYAASLGFVYRSFRVFHRQLGRCDAMRTCFSNRVFGNRRVGKCVIILTDKKVGMPKKKSV